MSEDKPEDESKIKVVIAPGAFDSFEGTQEELDGLIAEINRMAETGELFEQSQPLDIDNLDEDEMLALAEALGLDLTDPEFALAPAPKRTLQ
jgi:hypothetical protein